jgi:hypothetical protein
MPTQKQIDSNKANAQKSTGPRTEEGKAKSCLNRLSHGFASSATIIPGEDPEEFKALLTDLAAEHQPATATEQVLVEKMASSQWLSLRAFRLQGEAFLDQTLNGTKFGVPKDLGVLIRYHNTAERAFHKAHNEFVKAKKQRSNSEFGFEPQTFGQELPPVDPEPEKSSKPAPIVPISPAFSDGKPRPTFTAAELDFELCPEAVEFLKKAI